MSESINEVIQNMLDTFGEVKIIDTIENIKIPKDKVNDDIKTPEDLFNFMKLDIAFNCFICLHKKLYETSDNYACSISTNIVYSYIKILASYYSIDIDEFNVLDLFMSDKYFENKYKNKDIEIQELKKYITDENLDHFSDIIIWSTVIRLKDTMEMEFIEKYKNSLEFWPDVVENWYTDKGLEVPTEVSDALYPPRI